MVNPSKVIDEAFFAKRSVINPSSGCIEWTRYVNHNGYGTVKHKRKQYTAHRFAWIWKYGPISNDCVVCHKCDNRRCINLDHLFAGTTLDNVRDKINKGRLRVASGEESGTSKLTSEQVKKIMVDARPQRAIAEDYGICQSNVSIIKSGKAWKSLIIRGAQSTAAQISSTESWVAAKTPLQTL